MCKNAINIDGKGARHLRDSMCHAICHLCFVQQSRSHMWMLLVPCLGSMHIRPFLLSGSRAVLTVMFGQSVPVCSCRPTPCRVCRTCLSRTTAWIKSTTWNMTNPDQIALAFGTFCRGTGRPSILCTSIQADIQSSSTGNLGKRAGALCRAFGECDHNQFGAMGMNACNGAPGHVA